MTRLNEVRVVGTGLIGASIGLALRRQRVSVSLADTSPTALALARDLGAGHIPERFGAEGATEPTLVVVAVPPDVTAGVVAAELRRWPLATVTDVASVKSAVIDELGEAHLTVAELTRYVGSHPMAGRERSGAIAAKADLFDGRPWVLTPSRESCPASTALVEQLARSVGAAVTVMTAQEHDAAVAAVSHVPQVAASLVAARLRDLPTRSMALAGAGLRDVTRIAASDPELWTAILAGNADAVGDVLADLMVDLSDVLEALRLLSENPADAVGARGMLARLVSDGNAGHARIPGKHGATPTTYTVVTVIVPDSPGELGRLLVEVGEEGVNLEDLHLEHNLGRLNGIAEISVVPAAADPLRAALRERGWAVLD
ncbi:MAG TPA: prephenate dehydrogenase [Dermatophilaceae bacterium]|nr:prephenate dehydrogenase [Dermatophilaceae bacterium]